MDKDVTIALISGIVALLTAGITAWIKEQGAKVRIKESVEKTAQETAERVANITRLNYNEIQEDLAATRTELAEQRKRTDRQNTVIDVLYNRLSKQREYIDMLRSQLVTAGIIPPPYSEAQERMPE